MELCPAPEGQGTIPAVAAAASRAWPDATALDDGTTRLTFSEVADLARTAGAALADAVGPGDRIALWGANSIAWALASLAAHFAGATVVPVSTRYTPTEAGELLGRAGCRVIFADHEFLGRRLAAEAREMAGTATVVGLGEGNQDGVVSWPDLIGSTANSAVVDRRIEVLCAEDVSHIQFTSGTTGQPKGAMLRHGAMVGTTRSWVRAVGLTAGDRYPVTAPFSHIGGHKTGLLACAISGATALPFPTLDTERLLALIDGKQVSVLQGPPTMFQGLVAGLRRRPARSGVRVAVTGAAVVAPSLVRDIGSVLGVEHVFTAYGVTEASGVCTITSAEDALDTVARTSGRPVPGVEIVIFDGEGRPQPTGVHGELAVRGYNVMAGYLDDPRGTAEVIRDGWFHTGDVGWIGADGCLRIVDRLKDLVIVGGLNVYPAELERVLVEHPDVSQAAVVGTPDERLGEVPVAFVVARTGAKLAGPELESFCQERLANFKRPRAYRFVDTLPLNAAGKVVKGDLRRSFASQAS